MGIWARAAGPKASAVKTRTDSPNRKRRAHARKKAFCFTKWNFSAKESAASRMRAHAQALRKMPPRAAVKQWFWCVRRRELGRPDPVEFWRLATTELVLGHYFAESAPQTRPRLCGHPRDRVGEIQGALGQAPSCGQSVCYLNRKYLTGAAQRARLWHQPNLETIVL